MTSIWNLVHENIKTIWKRKKFLGLYLFHLWHAALNIKFSEELISELMEIHNKLNLEPRDLLGAFYRGSDHLCVRSVHKAKSTPKRSFLKALTHRIRFPCTSVVEMSTFSPQQLGHTKSCDLPWNWWRIHLDSWAKYLCVAGIHWVHRQENSTLATREVHIKALRYHLLQTEWPPSRDWPVTNSSEDVGWRGAFYTVGV